MHTPCGRAKIKLLRPNLETLLSSKVEETVA